MKRDPLAINPLPVLVDAERFISGFEGNPLQDGVDDLLTRLRATIILCERVPSLTLEDLKRSATDALAALDRGSAAECQAHIRVLLGDVADAVIRRNASHGWTASP